MQRTAPEAFDLPSESEVTPKQQDGTDNPESELFGRKCLLARLVNGE